MPSMNQHVCKTLLSYLVSYVTKEDYLPATRTNIVCLDLNVSNDIGRHIHHGKDWSWYFSDYSTHDSDTILVYCLSSKLKRKLYKR